VASLGLIVVRSSRTATAATSPPHKNFPAQNFVLRWFVFQALANASRARLIGAYGAIDCSHLVPGRDMLASGLRRFQPNHSAPRVCAGSS
jgi:hypothetical protein